RKLEGLRIERRAELTGLETLLEGLKKMPPAQLRESLPAASKDALLASLIEKASLAQQHLATVSNQFGANHAEVSKAAAALAELSGRIDSRIFGVLQGLDAKVASLREFLTDLESEVARAKTNDIEIAAQSRTPDLSDAPKARPAAPVLEP